MQAAAPAAAPADTAYVRFEVVPRKPDSSGPRHTSAAAAPLHRKTITMSYLNDNPDDTSSIGIPIWYDRWMPVRTDKRYGVFLDVLGGRGWGAHVKFGEPGMYYRIIQEHTGHAPPKVTMTGPEQTKDVSSKTATPIAMQKAVYYAPQLPGFL